MTQRVLIALGRALVLAGVLWPWLGKLGLGRLPEDIAVRRENFQFYFPVATCILVSALLTFLFWIFRK
ncbi:MAG: DUF2905 domain-containing protein [Nitrospinae bacterium]|nr:DUF2905 domain-containing protein [Nitrospinota bacterium]